jgi:hypothetical protein
VALLAESMGKDKPASSRFTLLFHSAQLEYRRLFCTTLSHDNAAITQLQQTATAIYFCK